MKTIRLWSVDGTEGQVRVSKVEGLDNTETEQHLEDLFVLSPDLLMENGVLIGRQVPTEGGWLDLVGVDQDGHVVVFELKRGTLTRDAVSQVLDYASDFAEMAPDRFARLIEEYSGRDGIDQVTDFADWYSREYPDAELLSEPPRMVLVGLGVDDRARRIVNFLADAGIDIQLLTFHAFDVDGRLLLARQVETTTPSGAKGRITPQTKESNRKVLLETAEELGVKDLLEEVAGFLEAKLPAAYKWPGKTAYSFSLQERTSEGKPSLRSYVTLYAQSKRPEAVLLTFAPRAEEAAQPAMDEFLSSVSQARRSSSKSSSIAVEVDFTRQEWPSISEPLDTLLQATVDGWQAKSREERTTDATEE